MRVKVLSANGFLMCDFVIQDLPEKPKYLLTFTVGIKQKEYVDLCIKKVRSMNLLPSLHFVSNLFNL